MTPTAADWVYAVVLTQRVKETCGAIQWTGARENRRDEGKGPGALRTCPCFWGRCGHCGAGRPDLCAHRDGRAGAGRAPVASIVTGSGMWMAWVWPSGRACKWHCPGPDLRAASQPALFALAGGPS